MIPLHPAVLVKVASFQPLQLANAVTGIRQVTSIRSFSPVSGEKCKPSSIKGRERMYSLPRLDDEEGAACALRCCTGGPVASPLSFRPYCRNEILRPTMRYRSGDGVFLSLKLVENVRSRRLSLLVGVQGGRSRSAACGGCKRGRQGAPAVRDTATDRPNEIRSIACLLTGNTTISNCKRSQPKRAMSRQAQGDD